LLKKAETLLELGVSKLALFPVTPQEDKSLTAEAAWHEDGLVQNTLRLLKKELPEMVLITDGALLLVFLLSGCLKTRLKVWLGITKKSMLTTKVSPSRLSVELLETLLGLRWLKPVRPTRVMAKT
jgi:hypothetical protein